MSNAPVCAVDGCERPSPGAMVCSACAGELARGLGDVPALARELEVTLARLAVVTSPANTMPRSRPKTEDDVESALPWAQRAREASFQLRNTLVGCVRELAESTPDRRPRKLPDGRGCRHRGCAGLCEERWPMDALASMAAWLLARVQAIRHHPAGGELLEEIRCAVQAARRAVDRPPDLLFAGLCREPLPVPGPVDDDNDPDDDEPDALECGGRVWLRPGATSARCASCGVEHEVADRRETLLASASTLAAHGPDIARFLSVILEEPVRPAAIRKLAHRKKLAAVDVDLDGRPRYLVGDVLALVRKIDDTPSETTSQAMPC